MRPASIPPRTVFCFLLVVREDLREPSQLLSDWWFGAWFGGEG